jgi:Holliday junction resolvase-like predicted endonuclease
MMAADYLARNALEEVACRFDVVAIDGAEGEMRIVIYTDAFGAL